MHVLAALLLSARLLFSLCIYPRSAPWALGRATDCTPGPCPPSPLPLSSLLLSHLPPPLYLDSSTLSPAAARLNQSPPWAAAAVTHQPHPFDPQEPSCSQCLPQPCPLSSLRAKHFCLKGSRRRRSSRASSKLTPAGGRLGQGRTGFHHLYGHAWC